ncbi:MAG: adenosylcobyric acid synthase [Actinomycetota bacterium]|nr:adenosylcobyric acid synthase [Actinomycetota bacterium]
MVAGASSDVGKSMFVAGLCRVLARRDVRVAPFKAQNMSLNSGVTLDGAEIGRAQVFQAFAAGIEPEAIMNPILLKPMPGGRSQVIVLGRAVAELDAGDYGDRAGSLMPIVLESLSALRAAFDVVILEGAGGAAEINLLDRDIVNLPLAHAARLPAIVVGDIDRGGVFASLYGTHALLPDELRAQVRGFVINKLRGDRALLGDGPAQLTARTGVPVLGVLPMVDGLRVDDEDSLALDHGWDTGGDRFDVAVVRFPNVSNITDLDPLRAEPGISVRLVTDARQLGNPDLVVLPGTRSTVADLQWLRVRGLDVAIRESSAVVLGVCGGYQMMGTRITDDVESGAGAVDGLGWLDVETVFQSEKIVRRRAHGYEIHHGVVSDGALLHDEGRMLGTSLHGLFDDDRLRHAFLGDVRGEPWESELSFDAVRHGRADALADVLEEHLDLDAVRVLIESSRS